jgi:hypothetical protein
MNRINFRFSETSKVLWHTCTVVLVLVLLSSKPARAQVDNTAYGTGALAERAQILPGAFSVIS